MLEKRFLNKESSKKRDWVSKDAVGTVGLDSSLGFRIDIGHKMACKCSIFYQKYLSQTVLSVHS